MSEQHESRQLALEFHPLTPERRPDFEALFGPRGATGGCWCMWWKFSRAEFERQKGEGNKRAMKALVESGDVPGILAYVDGRAVGWCAVAPRDKYPVLNRSRNLKPVDETPVWAVTCFFVHKQYRRHGITAALLRAAIDYVRAQGGRIVEGYPVEPKSDDMPDVFAWTGLAPVFVAAGFTEVLRRSEKRPIMRYYISE